MYFFTIPDPESYLPGTIQSAGLWNDRGKS